MIESKLPLLTEACRELCGSPWTGPSCATSPPRSSGRRSLRSARRSTPTRRRRRAAPPPVPAEEIARLYEAYELLRRERHLVDFETILELMAAVMTEHPEVAAQIRAQYRYFVVDEYQDVNPLQKLLLDTWLGGRDDLCVVGDPNQTIYSFTGATPQLPDELHRGVPGREGDPAGARLPVHAPGGDARQPGDDRLAQRAPAASWWRSARTGPEPVFTEYDDEPAEAEGVARGIRELLAARRARARDRRAVPGERPVRGVRAGARRGGRPVRAARRRAVLRAAGGAPGRGAAARGRPLGRGRRPARARGARRARRRRAHPRAARGRVGPGALGVAARRSPTSPSSTPRRPGTRPACPASSPSWSGGPPSSTPRR